MLIIHTIAVLLLLVGFAPSLIAQPRGNPEHPEVKQLRPWGMILGERLICESKSEEFARYTSPVGDVNHDSLADWTCSRLRCDTVFDNFGFPYQPLELLLYRGVRGGLPAVGTGQRIGPTEIGSETKLLATGDWDADGNRDLAVSIELFSDSSNGNRDGYHQATLVIVWGNGNGEFSIRDTSRLPCDSDKCIGIFRAVSADFDGDGVDDLLAWGGGGLTNGKPRRTASLFLFKGHNSQRWGRTGISRHADIQWWNVPPFNMLFITDQDCDGHRDIALLNNGVTTGTATASVWYGRAGALPDTAEVETVSLSLANGHYALLTDVTGDGVPELAVNCGSQEKIKLYAGKPGQRLKAQYGTGIEPENGRPWAEIWLPRLIHDGWSSGGFSPLYDMGDVGRDGVSDLWTFSWPFLICYNGGQFMDSLIDVEFDMRPYGDISSLVHLGDIDGSGRSSYVMTFLARPGSLYVFKTSDSVPTSGIYRDLPHPAGQRCEHFTGVEAPAPPAPATMTLTAVPAEERTAPVANNQALGNR